MQAWGSCAAGAAAAACSSGGAQWCRVQHRGRALLQLRSQRCGQRSADLPVNAPVRATLRSCFIEEFDTWNGGAHYEGQQFLERLKEFRRSTVPANILGMRTDWSKSIGFVDAELRFVQVAAKMSLLRMQGDRIKAPVLEKLMDFIDSEKRRAPPSMKSILQTVPFDWIFVETNRGLIQGLFAGFAISFPVAFAVLLVATRNLIVALVAIITVVFIVGNVLGYCKMAGWYLGIGECVAGIIVIGLAVDYTIHLGHAYLDGAHQGLETRAERWEFAMNTMGVTVIAGAVTTLFASLVMQFCQISFFNQMSTLIVLTISYSIFYTISFFMAALKVIGPQRKVGDIPTLVWWCRSKMQSQD